MRDGADHLMTVGYDTKRMTIYPIRAVEQYIAVGTALGWNMTQGYLLPRISRRPNTGASIRKKPPISASLVFLFRWVLALLGGAISGLVVLHEISPSTHREVVWSSRSVCRVYLWPESV